MPLVCPSANCRAPPVLKPFLVSYSCPLLVPPNQPVPVFLFYSPSDRSQTLCSLKLPFHDPSSYLVPLSFSFLFHPSFNCRSSSAHFNSRRSRYLAVSGQTIASLSRTSAPSTPEDMRSEDYPKVTQPLIFRQSAKKPPWGGRPLPASRVIVSIGSNQRP